MTFVLLQGAAASTVTQGPAGIVQRRRAVFSQAVRKVPISHHSFHLGKLPVYFLFPSVHFLSQLSAVVCGIMLKLYGVLDQPDFLQQLHSVGILAQFEGLLSTHGIHTRTSTHRHTQT